MGNLVVVAASRASALAMAQTRTVAARLARCGIATTILSVTTTGDRVQDRPISAIGSESLFIKELELALRDGKADYAVHSCKDLPSAMPADMCIAAISEREDPRDVFCSERYASFDDLPAGARVGTSSPRRRAQLALMRADVEYADIRGNVDTRLRKLRDGEYDAVVLAAAGLRRLGARAAHVVPFDVSVIVPAAAQGALAVETRRDDVELSERLRAAVNDERAERAVFCERAALRALQGGCRAPIGIHAHEEAGNLCVDGVVVSEDESRAVRARVKGDDEGIESAEALGTALAEMLLSGGARGILAEKEPAS
jgi:hydroxymethylbilane synthase